jgi:phenylalanyl-tRNA synthetase beta chain
MTPAEVLTDHPVGNTYASLVAGYDCYPAIYDDIGLFSFPPVINGRRTEVTTDSRDLLIEMTGTDQWTIDRMLNIVCYALDARGGQLESMVVEYPDHELVRPVFEVDRKSVSHDRVESVLGLDLEPKTVVDLAERAGLEAEPTEVGDDEIAYEVSIPPYRVDVLHPLDLIDDIGRAYGFNDLEPRYPAVSTVGERHDRARLERTARNVLVGLGFEDLLNFHLLSKAANFDRLRIDPDGDSFGAALPAEAAEAYQRLVEPTQSRKNNGADREAVALLEKSQSQMRRSGDEAAFGRYLAEGRVSHKPKHNFVKLLNAVDWTEV